MPNSNNNNMTRILFIGHLAIDSIIRLKKVRKPSLGGSVSFGSLALKKYTKNVNVSIISNLGKKNFNLKLLKPFNKKGIDLSGMIMLNTDNTNFVLDYFNHARVLTLKSRSPNLNFNDIPEKFFLNLPQIIILAPLCNEISIDYVKNVIKSFPNALVGVDLQGFIRKIDENGQVFYVPELEIIEHVKEIIKLIGDRLILKGSEIEMKILSGKENLVEVMQYFYEFNNQAIYIMTLGERGSMIIKQDKEIIKVPAFKPKRVADETGAGDVYLAIFMYEYFNSKRTWKDVEKAAYLASAAASFLVEKKGPSGIKNKKKVLKRVLKKCYINENC